MTTPGSADRTIEAGGLRWGVTDVGNGPPIVLLHGTGATRRSWDAMLPLLSPRYRLVAVDLPGHGGTSFPGFDQLTLNAMAELVHALLATLSVVPRAVVGHSAGAAIMLQLAAAHFIARDVHLIGVNAALEPPPEIGRMLMQGAVGDALRSRAARSVVRAVARLSPMIELLLSTTGSRLTAAQESDYVTAFSSGDHAEAAYAMVANWNLEPLRRALPDIRQPTVLIVGRDDPWVPARVSRDAARLLPNASVCEVARAGHLVHEERPQEVATLIAQALAGAGDATAGTA